MKFLQKTKNDRAASVSIEFVFMSVLVLMIFMMVADVGMYFTNRNVIVNSAQNGARLAAVYGGAGNTPIAMQYGNVGEWAAECSTIGTPNIVSCAVAKELASNQGGIALTISSVECGPDRTTNLGDRTYCEVKWHYKGLTSLLKQEQTTRMTAESEVVIR